MSEVITPRLIKRLKSEFRMNWMGIHGVSHWSRVRVNGLKLCQHIDADIYSDDLTVQVCWDADRLDLGRVCIRPEPQYLNT